MITKRFTLLSLAIKNIRNKPLRTIILVIAISLLVSALVFAQTFIKHINSSIKIMTDRLGADLLIVPTGSRGAAEDILLENKVKSFYMDKDVVEKIRNIKGIDVVTYQTYLTTLPGLCCDVPESMVVAFDQGTDFIVSVWLKEKLNRRLQKGEAIVGKESAFNINVGLMKIDSILFGNVFKMVGVLDKTGTGFDNAIFITNDNIQDILKNGKLNIKPNQISIVFAKIKNGYDPYKVAGNIEDSIIEVDAIARRDIGKDILNTMKDISRIFSITIILASILSLFLVWSVFSATANERAREVGILRAIGAKESHITNLFFIEVIVIGSIGSVLGIICGMVASFLFTKNFTILKSFFAKLSMFEYMYIAILGLVIGTVVCLIGSLSPIYRIKKIEPFALIKEN